MDAREAGRAAAQRLLHTDPLSKESVDMIADAVMDAFAPNHRAEVLREAAVAAEAFTERWPDIEAMKAAGIIGPFTALKQFADRLRRMAQDTP